MVLVTLGNLGALVLRRGQDSEELPRVNDPEVRPPGQLVTTAKFYPLPVKKVSGIASVSGAGDCFAAAFISSILRGLSQDQAISAGFQAAEITLTAFEAVPKTLTQNVIDWNKSASGRLL